MTTNRTRQIEERFDLFVRGELGQTISVLSAAVWADVPRSPDEQFGYMMPLDFQDNFLIVVCPEQIAEQTEGLNDDNLNAYLTIIELILARHIEYADLPLEERRTRIYNHLWGLRPDVPVLEFLNAVQMASLDAATGS